MKPLFLQTISENEHFRGMVEDHRARHEAYCRKHGYVYLARPNPAYYEMGWFRFEAILEEMKTGRYSHVFWIDADTFVADFSRDMRDTLPEWAWVAMTVHPIRWVREPVHLQTGIMYYRVCPEAIAFLETAVSRCYTLDQTIINEMLFTGHESARWQKGLRILPHQWNNNLNNQDNDPVVAAFHGYLSADQRRACMLEAAKRYPFQEEPE